MTLVDVNHTKTTPSKAPTSSSVSPMSKKRRFQRRNSKTAAMLRGDSWNLVSMLQQEHQQQQNMTITPQASYAQEERNPPRPPIMPDRHFVTLNLIEDSLHAASSHSANDDDTTRTVRTNSAEPPGVSNCPYKTTDDNSKSKKVLSREDVASLVASLLRNPRSTLN